MKGKIHRCNSPRSRRQQNFGPVPCATRDIKHIGVSHIHGRPSVTRDVLRLNSAAEETWCDPLDGLRGLTKHGLSVQRSKHLSPTFYGPTVVHTNGAVHPWH